MDAFVGTVDKTTKAGPRLALKMLSPAAHQQSGNLLAFDINYALGDLRDAPTAEPQVTAQVAFMGVGALEMEPATLKKPLNLEIDTCAHEAAKVRIGMLERKSVWICQMLRDGYVNLRWKGH